TTYSRAVRTIMGPGCLTAVSHEKNSCRDQLPSVLDSRQIIDSKDFNGSSTDGSLSFNDRARVEKMIVPGIGARIEKRNKISGNRVVTGGIRPLGAIAICARDTGVFHGGLAAMFFRPDMIQFMRQK